MNLVGRCREQGWGCGANPKAARAWYRRSAEAGYFRGQYNHGLMLAEDGRVDEAAHWIERALAGAPAGSRVLMARALAARPEPILSALAATGEAVPWC